MSDTLDPFIIHTDSTLKDALIQMTSSHRGILLVVDNSLNLVGVIADGDVRRALLDDVSLSIPISQVMNLNPIVAKDEKQAREILKENPFYILVPVVDSEGILRGVLSALNGKEYYAGESLSMEKDELKEDLPVIKYLAIIPARGGSKRIPGKNLSTIGTENLLSLAIKSAASSKFIDEIIVSTDSKDIANEAEKNGVSIHGLRPEGYSHDSAKTVDVLQYEVETYYNTHGVYPENIILLEPTAPLRSASLVDKAINHFTNYDEADSLVSVNKIRHIYHPEEVLKSKNKHYLTPYIDDRTFDNRKLRGNQSDIYVQNGLIYITKTKTLLKKNSIYGEKVLKFETPENLFADIDETEDLELARIKFKKLYPTH